MSNSDAALAKIEGVQKRALACAVVGIIFFLIWGWHESTVPGGNGWQAFFQSYIYAYVCWTLLPLGSLGFLMLHHLTGGTWGIPIRRILEASTRTLPVMLVLFVPIFLGISKLYIWAQPDMVAADPILQYKHPYLNPGGYIIRTLVYFAAWILIAFVLNKMSREQDQTGDPTLAHRMSIVSGPSFVVWALFITGASIDWLMSLEPHWFSTIYGFLFIVISGLAALCFSVLMVRILSETEPLKDVIEPKRLNDLGNLMLALVMLWTYMSFSQFLIIWAGNLKDEIPWYLVRAFGPWAGVAAFLLVFHFAVPFLSLLQRHLKRRIQSLATIAILILVLTLVDVYWLVVPAYETKAPELLPILMDIFALIGIGGLWLAAFLAQLKKRPLVALHDSRFPAVLEHEHGD
jgi:hypothetical protein